MLRGSAGCSGSGGSDGGGGGRGGGGGDGRRLSCRHSSYDPLSLSPCLTSLSVSLTVKGKGSLTLTADDTENVMGFVVYT